MHNNYMCSIILRCRCWAVSDVSDFVIGGQRPGVSGRTKLKWTRSKVDAVDPSILHALAAGTTQCADRGISYFHWAPFRSQRPYGEVYSDGVVSSVNSTCAPLTGGREIRDRQRPRANIDRAAERQQTMHFPPGPFAETDSHKSGNAIAISVAETVYQRNTYTTVVI